MGSVKTVSSNFWNLISCEAIFPPKCKRNCILSTDCSAAALYALIFHYFSLVFLCIFFRHWRDYNYKPRAINFASETESFQERDVVNGINLPQFSAARVPKVHDKSYFGVAYVLS